jgi:hypothetical protein
LKTGALLGEPQFFVHFSQFLIFSKKVLEGDVTSPYILCLSKGTILF